MSGALNRKQRRRQKSLSRKSRKTHGLAIGRLARYRQQFKGQNWILPLSPLHAHRWVAQWMRGQLDALCCDAVSYDHFSRRNHVRNQLAYETLENRVLLAADLVPYVFPEWDDVIVISTNTGDNLDDSPITVEDNVYFDFGWANVGDASTGGTYRLDFYLDGEVFVFDPAYPDSGSLTGHAYEDLFGNTLTAGQHEIGFVIDTNLEIAEDNEANNSFFRNFMVTAVGTEDFGDAPTAAQSGFPFSYPTTLADDGARHTPLAGFTIGTQIDVEADGQPDPAASLDDTSGTPDDEDGVTFISTPTVGSAASVDVLVTNTAGVSNPHLDVWIDFDRDGDWDEVNEHIFSGTASAGTNTLNFTVPAAASAGQTFARFRLYDGTTADGEVEDHAVDIATAGLWIDQGPAPTQNAQLEPNTQPFQQVTGAIHTVLAHPTNPDIVYIGAVNGGIWKTTNATALNPNWVPQTDFLESLSIGALAFDPTDATYNTLVAGTAKYSSFGGVGGTRGPVYRTTDGGSTWVQLTSNGLQIVGENISGIAARGTTIVVTSSANYGGVFRSTDGGANFSPITSADFVSPNDNFTDLVVDPSDATGQRLYAAAESTGGTSTTGGIYRSDDFGASWTKITGPAIDSVMDSLLTQSNNIEMAVHPTTGRLYVAVLVSAQPRGVFHTNNATAASPTWTQMDIPVLPLSLGTALTDASNTSPIQITSLGHGLSTGDFVVIDNVGGNTAANGFHRVTEIDANTFTLEGSIGNGTYTSGGTWTQVTGPNPKPKDIDETGAQGRIHFSIQVHPANEDILYIGGDRQDQPSAIGDSTYGGAIFRGDASIPRNPNLAPSPQWDHITHDIVAMDPDGGTANGTAPHADSREMTFDANGELLEVDDGGIYRRTSPLDNTGDWFSMAGDLGVIEFHDIAYDSNSNTLIGGTQDNGTHFQVTPADTVWDFLSGGDGGDVAVDNVTLAGSNQSIRYSSSQNLGSFQKTIWDQDNNLVDSTYPSLTLTSGDPFVPQFKTPVELNAVNPQRMLFVGWNYKTGEQRIYESTDQGNTIAQVGGTSIVGFSPDAVAYGGFLSGVPNPDVLYVGSGDEITVRTSFGGSVITVDPDTASYADIRDVVMDSDDWTTAWAIDNNQVFQSTDSGSTWLDVTGNLMSIAGESLQTIEYVSGTVGALVVGGSLGVFRAMVTSIGTWAEVGGNLPNALVYDLQYDATDDVLVAGTLGRGAWTLSNASSLFDTNAPPVLTTNAGATVDEGSTGNVITTAMLETTDVDNTAAQLTYTLTTAASTGTLRLSGTPLGVYDTFTQADVDANLVTFDHDGSETISDSFGFSVDDGFGNSFNDTFSFTVTPVNDEQVLATNIGTTVDEASIGNIVTTAMLETTDVDNTAAELVYTLTAAASNGTLRLSGTPLGINDMFTQADINAGQITYDHNGSETLSDSFDFSVNDGSGAVSSDTFSFTVTPVNDNPVATGESYSVDEDATLTATLGIDDLLLNDTDVDGDTLTVNTNPIVDTSNGTLVLSNDGTFTYTPIADYHGSDTFTYEISDGNGGTSQAVVNITVNPLNDAPIGVDDSDSTDEDTPLLIDSADLLSNDTDVDLDSLMITGFTQPANGGLVDNLDGTYTYTPNANFHGTDSFSYTVEDGNGGSDTANVGITVNAIVDTLHWQGDVDSDWSNPDNWLEGVRPFDGDSVVFDTATSGFASRFSPLNDVTGLELADITIIDNSNAGDFTLAGESITLTGGISASGSASDILTINFTDATLAGVTLAASQSFVFDTIDTRFDSSIDLATNDLIIGGADNNATTARLTGPISGSGGLTKTNQFQLVIGAANAYDGVTTVNDGVLQIVDGQSLGSNVGGTIVANGATLEVALATSVSIGEPLTIGGTGYNDLGALRSVAQSGWNGDITLSAASTIVQTNGPFNISGTIDNSGFDLSYDQSSQTGHAGSIPGDIIGAGGLIKLGDGQLIIQGDDNTYTGTTTISAGSINLVGDGKLGDTNAGTVIGDDASLYVLTSLYSISEPLTIGEFGVLAGVNGAVVDSPITLVGNARIQVFNDNSTMTISGPIDDQGSGYGIILDVFSAPNRTLVLSGTNTYVGDTVVSSGQLVVSGSLAGSTIVQSGAKLAGTGLISRTVTVQTGAVVSPGVSPGILTTGNVVFKRWSQLSVEIGGPNAGSGLGFHDQLNVIGTGNIGSNVTLNLSAFDDGTGNAFVPSANNEFVIIDSTGGVLSSFNGLPEGAVITDFLGSGLTAGITYQGGTDGKDVVIKVDDPATNDNPVSQNVSGSAFEDGVAVNISFNANDADVDDNPATLTYTLTSSPGEGSVVNNGDGTFTFNPGTDFQDLAVGETRDVTFTYTATDSNNAISNTATVTITVTGVNDEQVLATNTGTTINEASTGNVITTTMLETTDVDNTVAQLTYTFTSATANGTLRLSGIALGASDTFTQADVDAGLVTFDHDGSETVSDSFGFSVDDGTGTSSSGTFNITVNPVNDAPIANDNAASTDENTPVTLQNVFGLLFNDSDPDGDPLMISSYDTSSTLGSVTNVSSSNNGQYTYDPNGAFDYLNDGETGHDSFSYTVSDGNGGFDTATVNITVTGTTAPTPVFTVAQTSPTTANPINFAVDFGEIVTGFEIGDITVSNGTASNFATADNQTFTFDVTPILNGEVGVQILSGVVNDNFGTGNLVATPLFLTAEDVSTEPITLLQTLLPDTPSANDQFGSQVAISGNTLVVGTRVDNTAFQSAGKVDIYDISSGSAVLTGTIFNPSADTSSVAFGSSLALDGNRLVVGSSSDDSGAGSVYIYDLSTGTPQHEWTLQNPEPSGTGDHFGFHVAVQGSRLIVGADNDDFGGFISVGTVYVYDLSPLSNTTPSSPILDWTIANPNPENGDHFGTRVAIDGDIVVISALLNNTAGVTNSGSAYAFNLTGATPTVPTHTIENPDPAIADLFGISVSISGNIVAIGADLDDTVAANSGSVYIYDISSASAVLTDTISHAQEGARLGWSTSMYGNILVAAALADDTGADAAGSVYVYDVSNGTAVLTATINAPSPETGLAEQFGWSTSISGTKIVVGAIGDNTLDVRGGAAYIYELGAFAQILGLPTTADEGDPQLNLSSLTSGIDAATATYVWTVTGTATYSIQGPQNASTLRLDLLDEGTLDVALTVTDGLGNSASATETVTVANIAPTVDGSNDLNGQNTGLDIDTVAGTATLDIGYFFQDPGLDTWSAIVDYDLSDGIDEETAAPITTQGQKAKFGLYKEYAYDPLAYPDGFAKSIQVTLSDGDGGITTSEQLVVVGTTGVDKIFVNFGSAIVTINGHLLGTFNPNGAVFIYGLEGDDEIIVESAFSVPTVLIGGPGNDILQGGGGANTYIGGDGYDIINLVSGENTILDTAEEIAFLAQDPSTVVVTINEGSTFNLVMGSFTAPNAAEIDWGDGTIESGIVNTAAGTVSGSHFVADQGQYNLQITVTDPSVEVRQLTVNVANVAPAAVDEAQTVSEGSGVVTIDVLGNDSDPAGVQDPLTITGIDMTGTKGSVTFTGSQISYDPNGQFEYLAAGESTSDSFGYTIDDGDGGTASGTVTITIIGANDQPVISAVDAIGEVTESDATHLTDSGILDVEDPDLATISLEYLAVDTFDKGWYRSDGFHNSTNDNTLTGISNSKELRTFFAFDLTGISDPVVSAEFELYSHEYLSVDAFKPFSIFAVVTPISDLLSSSVNDIGIFDDLGDGTVFGTGTVSAASNGTTLILSLNSDAIDAINAALGGQFAFGLAFTDLASGSGSNIFGPGGTAITTSRLALTTAVASTPEVYATIDSVAVASGNDNGIDNATLLAMMSVAPNPVIAGGATTGTITWTFDSGSEAFNYLATGESLVLTYTIKATDDSGVGTPAISPNEDDSDTETVTITITGTNDGPTVDQGIADKTATEDSPFSFVVPGDAFDDVDVGDVLTLTASGLPAWLSFDGTTFSGTPLNADVGVVTITVNADDGNGGTLASTTFELNVLNTNDDPTVDQGIADQTATEDSAFSFAVPGDAFGDVDLGDSLTLTASGLPAWLSFDGTTFSGTPLNADVGVVTITVNADDGNGGTLASTTFELTVLNTNDDPTVDQGIADQTATEDSPFSFAVPGDAFDDVDVGDVLTLTASGLPAWLSFDGTTFSGTPLNADVGMTTITVNADDGNGGTLASTTFNLTVENTNDDPIAVDDWDATDEDTAFLTINVLTNDDDQDVADTLSVLSFDATSAIGIVTDNGDGTFNYDPNGQFEFLNDGESASDSFTYTVSDGNGGTSTATVNITIAGVNDTPSVSIGGIPATIAEGDAFTLTSTINLIDANLATYQWTVTGDPAIYLTQGSTTAASLNLEMLNDGSVTVQIDVFENAVLVASDLQTITAANVAPVVDGRTDLKGKDTGLTIDLGAQTATLDIGYLFTDPGQDNWIATIDYGDGVPRSATVTQQGQQDPKVNLFHTYTGVTSTPFIETIQVTLDDQDGGIATSNNLIVVGTPGNDQITINFGSAIVTINGQLLGTFNPDGAVFIFGLDGDDEIIVESAFEVPTVLDGGAGDDTLQGGGGPSTFVGGDGYDIIRLGSEVITILDTAEEIAFVSAVPANTRVTINEGSNFNLIMGSFITPNAAEIAWGDGAVDNGIVDTAAGTVSGSHVFGDNGQYGIEVTVTDPNVEERGFTINVVNLAPVPSIDLISTPQVEGTQINIVANATDPAGVDDTLTYTYGVFKDGAMTPYASGIGVDQTNFSFTPDDNGTYQVVLTVNDEDGGSASVSQDITVGNVAPDLSIDDLAITSYVLAVGEAQIFDGLFSDQGSQDTHTAEWMFTYLSDGSLVSETRTGTLTQGAGSGSVNDAFAFQEAGVYTVTLSVTDSDGAITTSAESTFVVYDPSAGFVTGGGSIDSPAGAFVPDPTLTGRATFGFVSKYKKGRNVPDGQTQFQFRSGDFDFHSDVYQWLVVGGARAQFKGLGTVNGEAGYGFLLTAIDGQVSGGGDSDKFRIKIFDTATDEIVYDNQMGDDDDAALTTVLTGGQVIIHKGNSHLLAKSSMETLVANPLDPEKLSATIKYAVEQWRTEIDHTQEWSRLTDVVIRVADLPGSVLGIASESSSVIWIDANAAGMGWFVDSSPWENSEFETGDGIGNRYDLLSVVAHELGHLLGFEHDVMGESLEVNQRNLSWLDSGHPEVMQANLAAGQQSNSYWLPESKNPAAQTHFRARASWQRMSDQERRLSQSALAESTLDQSETSRIDDHRLDEIMNSYKWRDETDAELVFDFDWIEGELLVDLAKVHVELKR